MNIEAIWVRRYGDTIQVLFESSGKWHLAIDESAEAVFSHIVEQPALEVAPLDLVAGPYYRNGQPYVTTKIKS